jgi:integrase
MKSIKTVIRKKVVKADGTATILLQYSYDRTKRTLLNTGKAVEPAFWDAAKGKVKRSHPQHEKINEYIGTLKNRLESIIDDARLLMQDPTIPFVKEKFQSEVLNNTPKVNGFYEVLDQYTETSKSRVNKGIISDYGTLKKYLQQFEKHDRTKVTFSNIVKAATYDDFLNFLRTEIKNQKGEKGLKINSVGKHAKNLKAFLNNCMRREIIPHTDLRFMKKLSEKAFSVYLNEEELQQLQQFDLTRKPEKAIIRDLFIIGAETGLRFSDYSRLTKHHLKDEYIRISTLKTKDTVIVPISVRLRTILNRYEDHSVFQITNQYFNREIKEIMKLAGFTERVSFPVKEGTKTIEVNYEKWELISSHTCRRSFCTNQFLKGVPALLIRKISGHKTEKAFMEYIKVDEELAAKEMLKYWAIAQSAT